MPTWRYSSGIFASSDSVMHVSRFREHTPVVSTVKHYPDFHWVVAAFGRIRYLLTNFNEFAIGYRRISDVDGFRYFDLLAR